MNARLSVALFVAALVLMISPFIGAPLDDETGQFILLQLRIPRVLMGALVGATLGITGAVYQTVFANPLATPSTVGTTAGASLGALAVLVLWPEAASGGRLAVALAAFAGALAVTAAIAAIAASGRARMEDVLLAGIALTLASGAAATGLQYTADMASTFQAVRWSLGHLGQVGYRGTLVLSPLVIATVLPMLLQIRALEAMVAGADVAHAQGVDVVRVRTLCLGLGALGVGACVAWCGPIAFVGLVVPHIVRLTVGSGRRVLVPMSAISGAAFLVACDALARVILPGQDLPVGVLTAAIGAPVLVALVARRRQ